MKRFFPLFYKSARYACRHVSGWMEYVACRIILDGNNVNYRRIVTNGLPFVSVAKNGKCVIGDNCSMNNNLRGNPIGRVRRCVLFVDNGAELIIGENVGMSSTALVAKKSIRIGNNVKLGGGVCVYDTDFHSLDAEDRRDRQLDITGTRHKAVVIGDDVFIGAHSTILKGVTIGNNAIVGACSVVTKDIPANEIWGGNPACFIRRI